LKKVCSIIGIILSFFIIYFLDISFFSWFNIAGIKPNLFIVLVLVTGLFGGKKVGLIVGIIIGLYLDILIGKSVGFTSILLMIIGFASGFFVKTFSKNSKILIIIAVITSTVFFEITTYIYNIIKFKGIFEFYIFFKILFIEIIFNSLLTIILYPTIQKSGDFLEDVFKKNNISSHYF